MSFFFQGYNKNIKSFTEEIKNKRWALEPGAKLESKGLRRDVLALLEALVSMKTPCRTVFSCQDNLEKQKTCDRPYIGVSTLYKKFVG